WIHPEPERGVVSLTTGESIDTAVMRDLGLWREYSPARHDTWCGEDSNPRCFIAVPAPNGEAPFAGVFRCDEDRREATLEGERWSLVFSPVRFCPEEDVMHLAAGDLVPRVNTDFLIGIRAEDGEGEPVDLVVTRQGRLYVGDADARLV